MRVTGWSNFVRVLTLVASGLSWAAVGHAQDRPPLAPGDRVRVTAGKRHVGTFEGVRADTLVLRGQAEQRIAVGAIQRLEVSRGRHRKTWSGATIGALAGAGAGVALGALASSCEGGECADLSTGEWIAASALGLGVVGGLVGALVGALTETDTWEEVPVGQLRAIEPIRQDEAAGLPAPGAERASSGSGPPARRAGMWGGFGAGAGWDATTKQAEAPFSISGPAAYLRLGATATPHLLVGGEVTGWRGSETDEWWVSTNALLTALVYPSYRGNLFIKAGIGAATQVNQLPAYAGGEVNWHAGFGANLGVGYDIPIGVQLALTPNLEVLYQTISGSTLIVLLSVGLTWH